MRRDRTVSLVAALGAVGVLLAVSACGAEPASTAVKGPKLLTGTQLDPLLLPAAQMPKGFKLSSAGARNSGGELGSPGREALAPGTVCEVLQETAWVRAAEVGSVAFAQNDYVDAAGENQVAQELDTYNGADAHSVMTALEQVFGGCRSFRESDGRKARIKLVWSRQPGLGDGALRAVMTSPAYEGGHTLVAVRVGQTVATVMYSSTKKDKGASAVRMARSLAQRVSAVG